MTTSTGKEIAVSGIILNITLKTDIVDLYQQVSVSLFNIVIFMFLALLLKYYVVMLCSIYWELIFQKINFVQAMQQRCFKIGRLWYSEICINIVWGFYRKWINSVSDSEDMSSQWLSISGKPLIQFLIFLSISFILKILHCPYLLIFIIFFSNSCKQNS